MDRRTFCTALAAVPFAGGRFVSALGYAPSTPHVDLARIERARVLRAADKYLTEEPITLTAYRSTRSAGGLHDYFSEADYFWPDPANPGGPYINRDGQSNPDNFNDHRLALIRLSLHVPALVAAWKITGQKKYAAHAADHLRAWFVTPSTRMNPNLEFAQAVHGRSTGRNYGIIDTLHLVEVARAITVMQPSNALSAGDRSAVLAWFHDYLGWLTTSERGRQERDTKNNHSTTWLMQAAEFARLTSNPDVTADCRNRLRTVIIANQIAPDGSFPLELARTKPYSYSLFNLDAVATCCQILSTPSEDLWSFETPDHRGIRRAIAFMVPFIRNKASWPYKHDVEHFDELPVRQPSLLFGGLALDQPDWIALWRTLDSDPTSPEIIRNFPIRQPILWVG
jgi:Alginate lyase